MAAGEWMHFTLSLRPAPSLAVLPKRPHECFVADLWGGLRPQHNHPERSIWSSRIRGFSWVHRLFVTTVSFGTLQLHTLKPQEPSDLHGSPSVAVAQWSFDV